MSGFDFSLFTQGGPMMWVLAALGVLGLMLFIERTLYLHRGQIRAKAFVEGLKNILAKRRLVEALTVCEETPGPVAAVVKAALLHADDDAEAMRFHVQEAAVIELPAIERRLGSIAAIAQVAPLVGLLGTLLGFITLFVAFQKDYMPARELSAGMWQALLSTAGSLMLAIPAHLAHHFLSGRVRAIVRDVEWSANEIMKYLLTEYRGKTPGVSEPPPSSTMITRPLDLASKLRPEPRNFDFLFFVNAGVIVLCFVMFGSRFVLTPGLGIDFQIPVVAGARSGAVQTTHRVTVKQSGLIFTDSGPLDPTQLKAWLADQAKSPSIKQPSLLIIASTNVAQGTIMEIVSAAFAAGFVKVQGAAEEPSLEKR